MRITKSQLQKIVKEEIQKEAHEGGEGVHDIFSLPEPEAVEPSGNPIEDANAYDYIHSYSPIENVKEQAYPPILATAGLTDPRVTYWEPAKWIAKLRATKTDKKPLYLRTNMEAGHAGAAGRFDRLEEKALIYAFLLEVMGFHPRPNV